MKTKPGVIRPVPVKSKILLKKEEEIYEPNPFSKYLEDNNDFFSEQVSMHVRKSDIWLNNCTNYRYASMNIVCARKCLCDWNSLSNKEDVFFCIIKKNPQVFPGWYFEVFNFLFFPENFLLSPSIVWGIKTLLPIKTSWSH